MSYNQLLFLFMGLYVIVSFAIVFFYFKINNFFETDNFIKFTTNINNELKQVKDSSQEILKSNKTYLQYSKDKTIKLHKELDDINDEFRHFNDLFKEYEAYIDNKNNYIKKLESILNNKNKKIKRIENENNKY